MSSKLDWSKWVARLGWRRQDEPPTVYGVQPVALAADHSAWGPHLQQPTAVYGGAIGQAGAAQFPGIRIECLTGAGVAVQWRLGLLGGATHDEWKFRVFDDLASAGGINGSGAPTGGGVFDAQEMGVEPIGNRARVTGVGFDVVDYLTGPVLPAQFSNVGFDLFCPVGKVMDVMIAQSNAAADLFALLKFFPAGERGT